MPNDSSTGGYLAPTGAAPTEDDALANSLQAVVVGITELPGALVRPRWQLDPPQQPPVATNWCAIGVTPQETQSQDPNIVHSESGDTLTDFEALYVTATFYGSNAAANATLFRDGIKIPQNTEALAALAIRWVSCGPIQAVPDLVQQQWRYGQQMLLRFNRAFARVYPVLDLVEGDIELQTDVGVVDTITVVDPLPL